MRMSEIHNHYTQHTVTRPSAGRHTSDSVDHAATLNISGKNHLAFGQRSDPDFFFHKTDACLGQVSLKFTCEMYLIKVGG